jgi:cGMP-specific 3',5'-cyclic phosphodiesterase
LGLLVACLCHDLDHRGTNNAFQTKTESPLAILYSTSTMEHHHFDQCVMILNTDSNNIFQALSTDDYRRVMKLVETAILSTDLAMYFKKRNKFLELIDNGEFDWQSDDKKELLSGMMMTACDVSAIAKPWDVQHRVAKLVADEFFDQGDMEKMQLKEQPIAMMDRERKDELPQMQVGFIDVICLPLYRVLSETFPWVKPLYQGTLENRKNWQDLAEKVEMGLTWIDHDTIDKPVEAFADTEETKDIELTVQTLHTTPACQQLPPLGHKLKRNKHKLCCIL